MLKSLQIKFALLVALLVTGGVSTAWAAEETFDFSAQGYTNQQEMSTVNATNFTVAFAKGTNSNAPKYYTSGTAVRCYGGNSFTVSSDNTITKIEITFGSSDGSNAITTDVNTYSDGSWTGSAKSVTFTIGGTSGNRRIQKLKVTYDVPVAADQVQTPVITIEEGVFYDTKTISISCSTAGADIFYTNDGSTPSSASTKYTEAFDINETTTVKAIAVKDGMTDSYIASETFTKVVVLDNIAALRALSGGNYYVHFTDVQVTYATGNYAYLKDASGRIEVSKSEHGLTAGDILNGIVSVTLTVNGGNYQLTALSGYEKEAGDAPALLEVAQADWDYTYSDMLYTPVIITSAEITYTSNKYYVSLNGGNVQLYSRNSSEVNLSSLDIENNLFDITCVPVYYNSYPELVAYTLPTESEKEATVITVVGGTEQNITTDGSEKTLTFSATASSGEDVSFALQSSTLSENVSFDAGTATLTVSGTKGGTVVIRATSAETKLYTAGLQDITVSVIGSKEEPTIVVNDSETIAYSETFTLDTDMIESGPLTLVSSNSSIASVDGLNIVGVAVGTVTITVNAAEDAGYKAGSESFTLNVTAPEALTEAPSQDPIVVFNETFDESTGTSGWSGNAASGTANYDNTGWACASASGNNKSIKLGTSSAKGSATTPALGQAGNFTLTFKSGAWSGDKTEGGLVLSIDAGEGILSQSTFNLTNAAWADYEVTLTGATTATKIKFSAAQNSKNRFFLDDVVVSKPADPISISATIPACGLGTYCSQYPLDFSTADDYKAYVVNEIDGTEVKLTKVTGTIKGGVPVILYGEAGTYTLTLAESSTNTPANQLVGTLAPTYVTTVAGDYTNFGLSGGKFVKINSGVVPAGKAYLPVATSSLAAEALTLVFDDEQTGISSVEHLPLTNEHYFNLQGQRVEKPARGLYIVGGKKVIRK